MNWLGIIVVAGVSFVMAGAATALLSGRRPGWRPARRILVAALVAPVLILVGASVGIALTWGLGDASGNHMYGLASAALLVIGGAGAAIGFVSGLLAAFLADRALRSS